MEAQRITIALTDTSAGFEATPERVHLGDWAGFSADVAGLLRGEDQKVHTNALEVVEQWQKTARLSKQVSYRISAPFLGKSIEGNAHIKLPDGRTLQATTERDVFARRQAVNRVLLDTSEDASTLAKYLDRARETGLASTRTILLRDGFDEAWFENGQTRLLP